jgi:hypothetical protein
MCVSAYTQFISQPVRHSDFRKRKLELLNYKKGVKLCQPLKLQLLNKNQRNLFNFSPLSDIQKHLC